MENTKIRASSSSSYDFTIFQLPTVPEDDHNRFLVGTTRISVISRENGRIIVSVEKYCFCLKPHEFGFAGRVRGPVQKNLFFF